MEWIGLTPPGEGGATGDSRGGVTGDSSTRQSAPVGSLKWSRLGGRSVRDGGLVLDMRSMNEVDVDPLRRVAVVGGGADSLSVASAICAHGLAGVAGNMGSVGFAGLTLGRGYGPLSGKRTSLG